MNYNDKKLIIFTGCTQFIYQVAKTRLMLPDSDNVEIRTVVDSHMQNAAGELIRWRARNEDLFDSIYVVPLYYTKFTEGFIDGNTTIIVVEDTIAVDFQEDFYDSIKDAVRVVFVCSNIESKYIREGYYYIIGYKAPAIVNNRDLRNNTFNICDCMDAACVLDFKDIKSITMNTDYLLEDIKAIKLAANCKYKELGLIKSDT